MTVGTDDMIDMVTLASSGWAHMPARRLLPRHIVRGDVVGAGVLENPVMAEE